MASQSRPKPLHSSRSFTRMEAANPPSPRKRASTLQEAGIPSIPEARDIGSPIEVRGKPVFDVFENNEEDDTAEGGAQAPGSDLRLPSTFEELPIEIRSLAERFLEGLSAKVHPTPLNADNLSDLFQDFYDQAASHIATHIASLASRIGRTSSSSSLASTRSTLKGRPRSSSGAKGSSDDLAGTVGGEMLTVTEVADRKKARRLLELKRIALEEGVERAVCEKVYDKIWAHRSTDDEARDEKLRSRTAALALVGIGLKELHMDTDPAKADVRKTAAEKEDEVYKSLAPARDAIQKMDVERYPYAKLQHLTAAHKSIVETLSSIFPSSSSADEILPTLIYTLITSSQDGINVVSNLNFIQRFRAADKVDGEAAYCLVNLEAAISFLETVDLSSLRADELPEGPAKTTSRPSTPTTDGSTPTRPPITRALTPGVTPVNVTSTENSISSVPAARTLPSTSTTTPSRPTHQRRLSLLMQAQADRLEAGRENLINAADKIYDSINGTLDNSFQFIFGRFKEQASNIGDSVLPKTLEEARKLVSSPTALERADEDRRSIGGGGARSSSGRSSPDPLGATTPTRDSRLLELVGGRTKASATSLRDHSVDSARSGSSGKRVAFATAAAAGLTSPVRDNSAGAGTESPSKQDTSSTLNSPAAIFASINPLNRFGMPTFPRFGRPTSTIADSASPAGQQQQQPQQSQQPSSRSLNEVMSAATTSSTTETVAPAAADDMTKGEKISEADDEDDDEEMNAREALATLRKIKPPRKRYLDVVDVNDLKIGEMQDLLLEYRRLAKAIGEAVAR